MSTNARTVPRRSCHTGCSHTSPRSPASRRASGSADPRGPNDPVLCIILHPVWARETGFQPTEADRLHVAGGGVLTEAIVHAPDAITHAPEAVVHAPDAVVHAPEAVVHAPDAVVHAPEAIVTPQRPSSTPQRPEPTLGNLGGGAGTSIITPFCMSETGMEQ
ncbi:unnamed protein product [Rangifer tarandus platyrhynchus]|uniref:Uncharacterized protein n=1 Tax=Rangifer tarandus platyrhynchus TaxID=3082113 RepID=A0ABN8YFM6_RANTA|nr:unnamed protein product [Rangifer tarandus platyrhynchus]